MRLARFVWFVIQHKLLLKQNRVNHHPFYLIGYSISFEKINKKWNGRLRTSLRAAAFKEALSTYFTAFPLRKQSFDLKNLRFGPISFLFIHLMIICCRGFVKRVVVVLFSFPALSVRHLVTHLRACAAYKLVRFTAGVRAYAWALLLSNAWGILRHVQLGVLDGSCVVKTCLDAVWETRIDREIRSELRLVLKQMWFRKWFWSLKFIKISSMKDYANSRLKLKRTLIWAFCLHKLVIFKSKSRSSQSEDIIHWRERFLRFLFRSGNVRFLDHRHGNSTPHSSRQRKRSRNHCLLLQQCTHTKLLHRLLQLWSPQFVKAPSRF